LAYGVTLSFPISAEILSGFALFLSKRLKSPSSIQNYLSGLKLLHKLENFSTEAFSDLQLKLVLRSISKRLQHIPKKAKHMNPIILRKMARILDFDNPVDATFWCLCLTAFFGLFRKSNLVPNSKTSFSPRKQFIRDDFYTKNNTLLIVSRWAKNNQYGDKSFVQPLPSIAGSRLCPVKAFANMVSLVPAYSCSPAFCLWRGDKLVPFTYGMWQSKLKVILKEANVSPVHFSSHSFRRGGATFAFKCQIPGEIVKLLGGWHSDCYLEYIDIPFKTRNKAARLMAKSVRR
jgi:hypothetical protein